MKRAFGRALLRVGERWALGYDAGESSRVRRDLGWGRASPRDEDSLVGVDGTRETMRQKAADLRRNGMLAGVCERIASYVVGSGINPQARTASDGWNKAAEQYFADWGARCDSRARVSLWALQWQAVALRPTHGGIYIELLRDGRVRPIECERIRQPTDAAAAKRCVDGVEVDRTSGVVRGYWVHARDARGGFSGPHTERYVGAANILPVIRPPWRPDQVREIPDFAPIVPALQDIHEMNGYTLATAKAQSMYVGALKKSGGVGTALGPRGSASTAVGSRQTFRHEWGQVLELFPTEDLDFKASPTPGAYHIPYIKLQLALAASALDLPYEFFTLDFSTADYSRTKAVLLLVNKTMRNWQRWLSEALNQPLWNWVIAGAIRDGDIPPAPTTISPRGVERSEWARVDWQSPEEPWIDRQEANQADMLEWQMGLTPLSVAGKRRGRDYEESLREKARIIKLAADIEAETGIASGSLIQALIPGQVPPPAGGTQ